MKKLTLITIKNTLSTNNKTKREKILSFLSFFIVFGSISTIMGGISYIFTTELQKIGIPHTFINVLLLANFFILLYSSIFSSINTLYFSKDLKILLRMPIKSKDIIKAKIAEMVITEYQMESVLLAIPMLVYGILTKANFLFYLYGVVILIILPVIPILVTSLINGIIMRFTNNIKNKNKVMYITIILTTIIISIMMSCINQKKVEIKTNIENIQEVNSTILDISNQAQSMSNKIIYLKTIMNALVDYDNIEGLKNLELFILENIICYIISINIISKVYFKGAIGTTINSHKVKKTKEVEITIKDCKRKNTFLSYVLKEILIILRAPMFLMQCVFSPIFLSSIVIISLFTSVLNLEESLRYLITNIIQSPMGICILILMANFLFMVDFVSIIGVSKEGKNARMVKYMPINLATQFKLKLIIGTAINCIITISITAFYYICCHNIILTLAFFIVLTLINIFGEKIKLIIDLKKPQLEWNSEFMMLKQNTNVMYILFYTIIVSIIIFTLSIIVEKQEVFIWINLLISLFANVLLNLYISKNINKIFKNIY